MLLCPLTPLFLKPPQNGVRAAPKWSQAAPKWSQGCPKRGPYFLLTSLLISPHPLVWERGKLYHLNKRKKLLHICQHVELVNCPFKFLRANHHYNTFSAKKSLILFNLWVLVIPDPNLKCWPGASGTTLTGQKDGQFAGVAINTILQTKLCFSLLHQLLSSSLVGPVV